MQQERAVDKHSRLVEAGTRVVYERGFQRTLLADIAKEAQVPQGSIYYYFKTKDEIVTAILDARMTGLHDFIKQWNQLADPRQRLKALIQVWVDDREVDSRYGCPVGSLCYELAKKHDRLSELAAEPLRLLVKWCEEQFRELGKTSRQAGDLAIHLMSALQGVSLLANAFGDPQVILSEARQLNRWLKEL